MSSTHMLLHYVNIFRNKQIKFQLHTNLQRITIQMILNKTYLFFDTQYQQLISLKLHKLYLSPMPKNIFLPGGIGYIGSHIIIELLLQTQHHLTIADNYFNSHHSTLQRIYQSIAFDLGSDKDIDLYRKRVVFYEGDIRSLSFLKTVFQKEKQMGRTITTIIHLAAKKSVPESIQIPLDYYENNLVGSMNLVKMMKMFQQCKEFIFSSSAAVYGEQDNCTQQFGCYPISPYGQTKLCVDWMLRSIAKANPNWKIISLRYFNPAGNHHSGIIGDNPAENVTGNLFSIIQQVIIGKRQSLTVFGSDYHTFDGSGVRDFVHVDDLAKGHLKALQFMDKMTTSNYEIFNLGSGNGFSVLQVIETFEEVLQQKLPHQIGGRRQGDLERLVTASKKAEEMLGWKTKSTLRDMCESCVKFTVSLRNLINSKRQI